MAVEEVNTSRKLLSEVSVGCTDFPRVALSFKWVINHAKALMSCGCELKSPYFKTPCKSSSWYLLLKIKDLHKVESVHHSFNSYKQKKITVSYFSIKLCFDDRNDDANQFRSYGIADCTFSILNSKTNEVTHSVPADSVWCYSLSTAKCENDEFFLKEELEKFVLEDILTIQVAASLIYTSPVHETYKANSLPLHDALDGLKRLHEDKSYSDVTIKCGEKEFAAHKAILASQSPVFNRMFETNMKEKASNVIEVTDIDPSAMSNLLDFLYTGSAPLIGTLAKELLHAASKYELPLLVQLCEKELMTSLHANNVLEMIRCADMYRASSLKNACLRMIKCHSEVFNSKEWEDFKANCDKELACEILEFLI